MSSLELKILACAAEIYPDSYQLRELQFLMSRCVDVDSLIRIAFDEGLSGFLYKSLTEANLLNSLNKKHAEKLRGLYHRNAVFNLTLIHRLKEILHHLNLHNIKVVPLKGIILLKQVYINIGLRQLTDIDLWTVDRSHGKITRILTGLGYQMDPVYPHTFRKDRTTIDLHSHILGAERIKARELLFSQNQSHFYNDTHSIDFEGEETLCLNKYDQIICLSLHALKHNVDRLMWLVDIKCLIADWEGSDWEVLNDRAMSLGQHRSVSYVIFLLHDLLGFQLSPEASKTFGAEKLFLLEKKLLSERKKKGALPVWAPVILFSPEGGLKNRFNFILETLFPRPEILRQVFESHEGIKVWELYMRRVCQLIGMTKNQ